MEIVEEGPRLAVVWRAGVDATALEQGLLDADYEIVRHDPTTRETRFRHPNGSQARFFEGTPVRAPQIYVYPPGGTRHQTGPIQRFSPLKRACDAANERAGWGPERQKKASDEATDASGDADPAAGGSGPGDPPPKNGADDGDDE